MLITLLTVYSSLQSDNLLNLPDIKEGGVYLFKYRFLKQESEVNANIYEVVSDPFSTWRLKHFLILQRLFDMRSTSTLHRIYIHVPVSREWFYL